ncbi:MAG: transcription antitermination factor NusB [Myxococcaceae bacterium]
MSQDPRKIAAQVIEQVFKNKSFSKQALSHALDTSKLSERDKGLCTELVYGTLRWMPVLEASLLRAMDRPNPKLASDLKAHLLVAAYQLQHLQETIPAYAAVSSAVNLIKRKRAGLAGFANAILRRLGSAPHLQNLTHDLDKISAAFGLPVFLLKALPQEELLEAALAMNSRPQTWYWNPVGQGDHPFVPTACFEGSWVQDPASQVAGLLVNPKPGQYVIDACAAPGSKSRILKHAVGQTGRVLAIDQNAKRLELVDSNIETQAGDFRTLDLEPADAILLDAPCSGYGTLRRHPEIKFWRSLEDIHELANLQAQLLDAAVRKLKPGGVLVYSVCSPLPEEGSEQIARFLERHPDFKLEDPRETLPWLPEHTIINREIHLWPHRDQADAFFAVRLIRGF